MKKIICAIISMLIIINTMIGSYALETVEKDNNSNKNISNELMNEREDAGSNTNNEVNNTIDNFQSQNENLNTDENFENRTNEYEKSNDKTITSVTSNSEESFVEPVIIYQTHIQDYGWNDFTREGVSGTIGKSKRIEAYKLKLLNGDYGGNVIYSSYIENYGWSEPVSDEGICGTTSKSLRIEAIKVNLDGDIANYYSIYYRVHIQDYGWLGWTSNGSIAGSEGLSKRIEAIEIKLIKKDSIPPEESAPAFIFSGNVYYNTHVQDIGWASTSNDGQLSGTVGKSKRIEAIKISVSGNLGYQGGIEYSTHIQDIGWQAYAQNGQISGTTGKSKRIEAIKVRLNGELASYYDVYYRVHVENYGWLSWAKDDHPAGTEGLSLRIEAIELKLIKKGDDSPTDITMPYIKKCDLKYSSYIQNIGWMENKSNGAVSGTVGKGLRMEAVRIYLENCNIGGNVEYSTMCESYGWQPYVSDGNISGITGNSKRVEAIKIRLTGEISKYFDICYRVQCQKFGWLGWTGNDRIAGTIDGSYRIEAIQIKLSPKSDNIKVSNNSMISFVEKNGFKIVYDSNGRLHEDAQNLLGLQTAYVLRVNKKTNVVTVIIDNGDGNYNIAYKRFICSTGNDTPYGTYYTPAKYRWKELMGPSYGQYSTRIVGGILFHSVPYKKQNPYTLSANAFNQLGTTCSHGCIRLMCIDAKWIYDNCGLGTRVDIINGVDPLSKPTAPKISSNQTWDPTDPNL